MEFLLSIFINLPFTPTFACALQFHCIDTHSLKFLTPQILYSQLNAHARKDVCFVFYVGGCSGHGRCNCNKIESESEPSTSSFLLLWCMMQPKLQMTKQSKTQLIQVLTTNLGTYVYTYKQQQKKLFLI